MAAIPVFVVPPTLQSQRGNPIVIQIFADGTFKVCPEPFYQLYILHRVYGTCTRPCLFILMTRKTRFAYDRLFSTIRNFAAVRGHEVKWVLFHSDFEIAVMSSVQSIFAHINLSVKGCYFHLASAMFKKAVVLGFKAQYKLRPVKFHIKMCMALAFLPVDQIAATLDEIIASYTASVFPGKPDLTAFFAYVRVSWVLGGVVSMDIWSFYGITGRCSTCDCEGYHSKIAKKLEKTASLWQFINKLKKEENVVHLDIASVPQGGLIHPFTSAQRVRENTLADYRLMYNTDMNFGNIQYVRAVATLTMPDEIDEVPDEE